MSASPGSSWIRHIATKKSTSTWFCDMWRRKTLRAPFDSTKSAPMSWFLVLLFSTRPSRLAACSRYTFYRYPTRPSGRFCRIFLHIFASCTFSSRSSIITLFCHFIILLNPEESWYSCYRPAEGRRLSRPQISLFISPTNLEVIASGKDVAADGDGKHH